MLLLKNNMSIKDLLPKKSETKKDLFWSVVIESGWIQAGVWEVEDEIVKVVSVGPPCAWKTDEELISCADSALSAAVGDLDENAPEPEKTVFGVSTDWVSEGEIKQAFLDKLKGLCTELSLKPSGFVVLPEAIAHYVKIQDGSPLSGVVIGVEEEKLEITVFRLGKSTGTKIVSRSVNFSDDVIEGLTRFPHDESFPSRFLLYDGKEGELREARQSVMDVDWGEKNEIKFLHTPKVEILSPDKKVMATALAGASEKGKIVGIEGKEKEKEESLLQSSKELENLEIPDKEISVEDVGFVVGEDIKKSAPMESERVPVQPQIKEEVQVQSPIGEPMKKKKLNLKIKLPNVKEKIFKFLDRFGKSEGKVPKQKKLIIFGVGTLVALITFFSFWWFYPSATVTVYVSPRTLDKKTAIFVDTDSSKVNTSKKTIPGKLVEVSESGEKTTSTTGTKVVGDKARGVVEIRNGTSSIVKLSAGATLLAGGDLEYVLSESASISAALSTTSPGKTSVEVEAKNIGAEYNLAKDETFKVSNYLRADVDAISTSDFSGGSSREMSAVSEDDMDLLLEELEEELSSMAEGDLNDQISSDSYLIKESVNLETVSRDYSAKEGDEADTLKLSLETKASALVVSKENLFDLIKDILSSDVPDGYVLRENQVKIAFSIEDEDGGEYELEARIESNLLPEIKTDEIADKIVGKLPDIAKDFLTSVPGFSRVEIRIKPSFPGKLKTLPHVVKRIDVEVAAER